MANIRKSIALTLIVFIILIGIATNVNAASYLISMSKTTISNVLDQKYTGAYIKPNVVVRYNGNILTKNIDYTLSYSNNRNVGTATIRITGKGNYIGTRTVNFKIVRSSTIPSYSQTVAMSKVSVDSISSQSYTGGYITPSVTVRYNGEILKQGTDYTLSYSNNRNVGTATIKITGKGDFTGTKTVSFRIVSSSYSKISISNATVSTITNQPYTGGYIRPNITVRYNGVILDEGTDYTLSYSNNRNVGTATIKITGKGNFTGTRTVNFRIVSNSYNNYYPSYNNISISNATVSSILNQKYTGGYITPSVTVRYNGEILEEGEDYTLSYSNNKSVGTAKVRITGIGNFTGTKTVTFLIVRNNSYNTATRSLNAVTSERIEDQYYTGCYIEPNVVLRYYGERLIEGVDYTVTYSNNKNIGCGKIYIVGIGDYSGTRTIYFNIKGNYISISNATVSTILNQPYTGYAIRPSITVRYNGGRLEEGIDYTLSYSNNKNVGTATIKITGKGNFRGTKTVTFKIVDSDYSYSSNSRISLSNASVSKVLNQMYTGSYIRPNVVLRYNGYKLEQGTDYTVSYSNNRNVGTATIKITGIGRYKGTKTVTFKIVRR